MTWHAPADAAKRLGIAPRTLRDRANFPDGHPLKVVRGPDGRYWLGDVSELGPSADTVAIEDPVLAAKAAASGSSVREPTALEEIGTKISLEDIEHDTEEGSSYHYIPRGTPGGDRYIFALRSKAKAGKPTVIPGDAVRALVLAYSNDGAKATLNEIARTFGLSRPTARDILKALGKTHDSAPFTDEEIAERDESGLSEDLVRLKEERVLRKAEKAAWDETRKLADKARHFDKFVAERIEQVIRTEGVPSFPAIIRTRQMPDPFSVFVTPSDLHYGKAGWKDEVGGEEYSREECHRRLMATADAMIERVLRFGRPARFIYGAGSDWSHIDNETHGGSTTRGTPQDTDGSYARIFLEGGELQCAYVDRLRQVAPVVVKPMRGNHDFQTALASTVWLRERFRSCTDVEVTVSPAARQYLEIGKTLVGITHGDGLKDDKLAGLMPCEAREAWGRTRHRIWFTGHWHSMISNEILGVRVIHVPSLAGSDSWHARAGYVGNRKALTAYVIDNDEGLIAELPVSAR